MAADTTNLFARTVVGPNPEIGGADVELRVSNSSFNGLPSSRTDSAGSTGPFLIDRLKLQLNNDEELTVKLRAGHVDALTILFERYRALLFRNALHILRDSGEAEDAVQQVFLDLFSSVKKFDSGKASFKTWFLMIAHSRFIERWRQLQSSHFHDSVTFEDALSEALEAAKQRPFPFYPYEAVCIVEQALRLIKPQQRRTIELVYYEGLTAAEVSKKTGESVRVVRHNLYRGLEKIRYFLGVRTSERNPLRSKKFGQERT